MRALLALVLVAGCPRKPPPAPPPAPIDVAQAEQMLELLRAKPPTAAQLDAVMAARGTQLIIAQQNLARKITPAQYRAVLAAATADAPPAIAPADDGERAARGVRGLVDEVWPALHWGATHPDELAGRITALRGLDATAAMKLAVEWLPDRAPPEVTLHVVMGGRAGGAAIDHDLYFDVLATSYRTSVEASPYPSPAEVTEYFAHEVHHVGLAAVIDRTRGTLALAGADLRAFDLLATLVSEGSATYLITAHHDLELVRREPEYAEHLADPARLVSTFERILDDVVNHDLDGDAYEKAISPLVASGFHAAGALLLDAIYRAGGHGDVDAVLRDPRKLPGAYNAAAVALTAKGEQLPPMNGTLAERIAHLGERR